MQQYYCVMIKAIILRSADWDNCLPQAPVLNLASLTRKQLAAAGRPTVALAPAPWTDPWSLYLIGSSPEWTRRSLPYFLATSSVVVSFSPGSRGLLLAIGICEAHNDP